MAGADDEKESQDGKKKKKALPLFWIFVATNILVLSIGVFLTYLGIQGKAVQGLSEEDLWADLMAESYFEKGEPILLAMEPIVINLDGSRHVANLEMNFELTSENSFEEVMLKRSLARDALVSLLHGKTYSDLESLHGKLLLKDQMIRTVNSLLDEGVVRDVFFSQFVVEQR